MTLWDIFNRVIAENERSKEKYGMWRDIPEPEQKSAIVGEINEWLDAYINSDVVGEHGEIAEAIQTINVLCRRIQFLTGEADA